MRRRITVLFSSAGRRVELIRCFRADAERLDLDLRAVAVDIDPAMSAACCEADMAYAVPRCTAPDFIDRLAAICRRESVDLLVPTIDTELPALAGCASDFQRFGTDIVISAPSVVGIARDKLLTAEMFRGLGVPVPRTAPPAAIAAAPDAWDWPLMLKPRDGSASSGILIARTPRDLDQLPAPGRYIGQELLRGREYTVNLFFDRHGRWRCAVPHLRYETRAGEVSKGIVQRQPALEQIAATLGHGLRGARGPLCFQAFVDEAGEARPFELNARFGGGFPLAHRAGARFSQWLLEEAADLPRSAANDWSDGVIMLRYDAAFFIEAAANG